jgi:hypothetical protein
MATEVSCFWLSEPTIEFEMELLFCPLRSSDIWLHDDELPKSLLTKGKMSFGSSLGTMLTWLSNPPTGEIWRLGQL